MPANLTLIDAGTGNLRSVYKALEKLGADVELTSDPGVVSSASKIVLPGVGAFGDFMNGLRQRGLVEAILYAHAHQVPTLGICVGMQALYEFSEEMGKHAGLRLLPGKVIHFPAFADLKIPHTGWNQLHFTHQSPLVNGLQEDDYAYFNHSYYCTPPDDSFTVAWTDYGIHFTSAIQKDHIFGVQFHPEKSQRVGLTILRNFLAL
jgi:imidazole glycerol-phosphate synthase subunit HisH